MHLLGISPLILLLLLGTVAGQGTLGVVNTSQSVQQNEESLDIYTDLLMKRYTTNSDNHMKLADFNVLWTNIRGSRNVTASKEHSQDVQCNQFGKSPLCLNKCADAQEIFDRAAVQNTGLDRTGLKDICPLLLYQLDSGLCGGTTVAADDKPEIKATEINKKPSSTEVWGYGVLFVTLISLCSLVGVSVLPMMGKAFYTKLLTALIGLAVGSLAGSSAFHLIPQAFGLPDSDPDHHYLQTSVLLCGGVWLFFMIERFLKMIMDWKEKQTKEQMKGIPVHQPMVEASPAQQMNTEVLGKIYESQEQVIKASFGHPMKPQRRHSHEHMIHFKSGDSPIATVAWMIIFGDGFHNFIDGLSLGAAFNESIPTGISISLAVMCEELPHELGDFAVLLSAGMTMRQALLYNFLSACTCYAGLAVGIVLGEFEASQYIFALAGGMFLYISLVDMMPEMNEVAEKASREGPLQALKVLVLQNIGILSGVGALYVLARYQDQIRFG